MNVLLKFVVLVSALWVIYDVWSINKKLNQSAKLFWTVLALLFSVLTAVVYFFMFKKK